MDWTKIWSFCSFLVLSLFLMQSYPRQRILHTGLQLISYPLMKALLYCS